MNKVILIGRIGRDPETRQTNNSRVSKFSLATTYRSQKGNSTDWHNIVVWGKLAEVVERYCSKGSRIAVIGRLTHRQWVDKDDNKRNITEIVATELELLDSSAPEESEHTKRIKAKVDQEEENSDDGNLPF